MLVVAILTIRDVEAFREFESRASEIMARHGGSIEHAYALDGSRELHVVRFPTDDAFAAYREDPALVALGALREQAIAATETLPAREVRY